MSLTVDCWLQNQLHLHTNRQLLGSARRHEEDAGTCSNLKIALAVTGRGRQILSGPGSTCGQVVSQCWLFSSSQWWWKHKRTSDAADAVPVVVSPSLLAADCTRRDLWAHSFWGFSTMSAIALEVLHVSRARGRDGQRCKDWPHIWGTLWCPSRHACNRGNMMMTGLCVLTVVICAGSHT